MKCLLFFIKYFYLCDLNNDSVAQLVEHYTFNVVVLGSNPSGITENLSEMKGFFVLSPLGFEQKLRPGFDL